MTRRCEVWRIPEATVHWPTEPNAEQNVTLVQVADGDGQGVPILAGKDDTDHQRWDDAAPITPCCVVTYDDAKLEAAVDIEIR